MSFFKNIAVTYWTSQIYNDGLEDIEASIEEIFSTPLIDSASNYVCAVERMELSGNGIFFYDSETDADATYQNLFDAYGSQINVIDTDGAIVYTYVVFGSFHNLVDLLEYLNDWGAHVYSNGDSLLPQWIWKLNSGGKICIDIQNNKKPSGNIPVQNEMYFGSEAGLMLQFDSEIIASIFGLPQNPIGSGYNSDSWYKTFSNITPAGRYRFQTKTSRLDVGIVPTMIQLRSNLPFESDQVSQTKTNIVTDFNIVAETNAGVNYTYVEDPQEMGEANGAFSGTNYVTEPSSTSNNVGMGSMIVYNPPERRWLNFSAPVPIYTVRLWAEIIYNNPDESRRVVIPPGGKFSIKLGFYLRQ